LLFEIKVCFGGFWVLNLCVLDSVFEIVGSFSKFTVYLSFSFQLINFSCVVMIAIIDINFQTNLGFFRLISFDGTVFLCH
jgi:hypothetical protein